MVLVGAMGDGSAQAYSKSLLRWKKDERKLSLEFCFVAAKNKAAFADVSKRTCMFCAAHSLHL